MTVIPFGGRIAVEDAPMSETVRDSGLIVVSNEMLVDQGICVANPAVESDDPHVVQRLITLGSLVYYERGPHVKIGTRIIVPVSAIIAYEEF